MKIARIATTLVMMSLLLFVTACGESTESTSSSATSNTGIATLEELLDTYYDIQYIYESNGATLTISDTIMLSLQEENRTYFAVDNAVGHTSLDELAVLVSSCFADDSLSQIYTSTPDRYLNPLFIEQDGKLYMSTTANPATEIYKPDHSTITIISEDGNNIIVTAQGTSDFGDTVTTEYSIISTESGYLLSAIPTIMLDLPQDTDDDVDISAIPQDPAATQIKTYLDLFGNTPFDVASLPHDKILVYCLYELTQENPNSMTFTQEQVNALSLKYFNVSEVVVSGNEYIAPNGEYALPGRAPVEHYTKISDAGEWQSNYIWRVEFFTDATRSTKTSELLFTMSINSDGSYEFVSSLVG